MWPIKRCRGYALIDVLGYDSRNVFDLRDAGQSELASYFGKEGNHEGLLWRYVDPRGRSDVLVFYSGHGVPGQKDKRGYLLPVDANPNTAGAGQLASWDEERKHGLFTDRFLAGAYGAADADKDGKVTLAEMREHLVDTMTVDARRTYGRIQEATASGPADAVLVALPQGQALSRPNLEAGPAAREDGTHTATAAPPPRPKSGQAPVSECDKLAANSADPRAVTPGVSWINFKNPDAAISPCREAVARYANTPRFKYQLARALDKSGNAAEAIKWYRQVAVQNYAAAQLSLGSKYLQGKGVAKDEAEAVVWFQKAADQGLASAQFVLGRMYDNGSGVRRDVAEARGCPGRC